MKSRIFTFLLPALLISPMVWSGGKNKIQYEEFAWKVYYSQHFKVFYYEAEARMLPEVVDMAEAAYKRVSEKLQHELRFQVPFVFYKTHEEFEQTNIFGGFIPKAVGAFAEPFQSRMVLPLDNGPEKNYALIVHELTHIFQYDLLYNNKISTIIRSEAPTWFTEGMASYVADDEDNLDRMVLRDAAISSNFDSLGNFSGFSFIAYRIGHAAFEYMEETYGIEGVRNFIWQYRKNITGSIGSAIERAFEIPVNDFDRSFRKYLRKRYIELLPIKEEPDDFAREIRSRKTITTLSPELSPSGDLFAAIVPIKNELDLVLISTKDGRIFKNLTRGYTNRYHEINIGAFEGVNDLGWSPDGNRIIFSARKESSNRLYIVNVLNGQLVEEIKCGDIRDAQAPIFGPDENTVFFSGNTAGYYDIWRYDRTAKSLSKVTEDVYHDKNPRLSPDGKKLVYSSLRDGFYKIFDIDLASGQKTQLTSGLGNDIQAAYSSDMSSIYFSSDRFDDIYNIYELELATGIKKQYTNILTGAFSPQERVLYNHKEGEETRQLVFTAYYQGRFRVYRMDKPQDRAEFYDVAQDNFANVKEYDMSANIQLEPERNKDYSSFKTFKVSDVAVNAGVTDDGRVLSNTAVTFSDVLGDRLLDISAYTVSSFENYSVNYLDRSRRLQWGVSFNAIEEFFVDQFSFRNERQDRIYKNLNLGGYLRYPLSLNNRFSFGAGMTDQDVFRYEQVDDGFIFANVDFTEPYAFVSFSRDSIRYMNYGPQQGMLLDVSYQRIFNQNETWSLDFRTYKELTRRSLLAWRTLYNFSDGDTPDFFTLGGNNYLRGNYSFQEFVGSRRFLTQWELRFPVIDAIRFPGFGLSNIRGALFVEAGGTWFEQTDFQWEFQSSDPDNEQAGFDPENPNPNYLIGAYGFEVMMNFAGLELHWTWSKRTNFDQFPSSSRFGFWIGRTF